MNGNQVITNALANLSDGKNVQVEKVLKLNKTEVMDLILEEVIAGLDVQAAQATKEKEEAQKALNADLELHLAETTGFTELMDDDYNGRVRLSHNYTGKSQPRFICFCVKTVFDPKGQQVAGSGYGVELRVPAPDWAEGREAEVEQLEKRARELRCKAETVKSSRTKFKSAVLRTLLNEHAEGQALLTKVKEVAKKLT